MKTLLFIIGCLFSLQAVAGRITQVNSDGTLVGVNYGQEKYWRLNDKVCLQDTQNCGKIVLMSRDVAVVKLGEPALNSIGSVASLNRDVDLYLPSYQREDSAGNRFQEVYEPTEKWNVSLAAAVPLSLGSFMQIPVAIGIEHLVDLNVGIGIKGRFKSILSDDKTLGASLTGLGVDFNYYSIAPLEGFWVRVEAAGYLAHLSHLGRKSSSNAYSFSLLTGYHGRAESLHYGFGMEMQYVAIPHSPELAMSYARLIPSLSLRLGFHF